MSISKQQESVLAIIAGLVVATLLNGRYLFLAIAGALGVTLPFPAITQWIHLGWMFISNVLGWIMRHIILFILFFVFLTPFAFLLRLFGKRTMLIHRRNEESFFVDRKHVYGPQDFINPW